MYSEDELIPISALQHLAFCERQWALIHLERIWSENRLTAEGRVMHTRVHESETESRGEIRICRSLRLHSLHLGLSGIADVVEFRRIKDQGSICGVRLPGTSDLWTPLPVEYKRGRPKSGSCDEVQLCAQAMCIEEMLNTTVPNAALFYGKPLRRFEVPLTPELRRETERLAKRAHEMSRLQTTPPPIYKEKCHNCSLLAACMPKRLSKQTPVDDYVFSVIA